MPSTARIGRAPFHRARSASKEGIWSLPPAFESQLYGETLRVLLRPGRSAPGPCRDSEVEEVAVQAGQIATV